MTEQDLFSFDCQQVRCRSIYILITLITNYLKISMLKTYFVLSYIVILFISH